jgi:apolipoprotein N-acyltransferase
MASQKVFGALFAIGQASDKKRRIVLLVLGLSLSLGFAPYDFPFIVFLVVPPLLVFIKTAVTPRQAAVEGWMFGFGHFLTSLYWIGESFAQQDQVPLFLAPIAVVLMVAILSLYFACLFWLLKVLEDRYPNVFVRPLVRAIAFAALWVVLEQVRGILFTGFPWNPLGTIWVSFPILAQTGALWGVYGLSFFSCFLPASLLSVVPSLIWEKKNSRSWARQGLLPLVLVLVFVAYGFNRIENNPIVFHDGVNLRLVQPNISQLDKWRPELREGNFFDHIKLSTSNNPNAPSHFIWSESAITYLIDGKPTMRKYLGDMLGDGQVLISGAPRLTRENGYLEAFNSIFVFNDDGLITNRYDKSHLVPFGEYVPLRGILSLIGLDKLVPGALDFSSGHGPQTINIEGLPPVSPLICYEIIFPGNVLDQTNRPSWLLNITNDSWFGTSAGPFQHFAMARMRAIEEGLPVVRNAGSGISAVISPLGTITAKLSLNTRGVLDANLPKALSARTIYSYITPYIFLAFLVIFLSIILRYRNKDI